MAVTFLHAVERVHSAVAAGGRTIMKLYLPDMYDLIVNTQNHLGKFFCTCNIVTMAHHSHFKAGGHNKSLVVGSH